MRQRMLLVSLLSMLWCATIAVAQTAPPATAVGNTKNKQGAKPEAKPTPTPAPAPPAPPAMQPDQRAYMEAMRIKDPVKKIEALEKFIADFPSSFSTTSANLMILDTLVKQTPRDNARILAHAKKIAERSGGSSTGFTESSVAQQLFKAGLYDEAEKLALQSSTATDQYIERQMKMFQQQKARPLALLGQIYLKQNKLKEAEIKLKAAYAVYPQEAGVAVALAEIAEKKGRQKEAVDYLLAAGRLKAEERQKLETLWRKTHNDSLAGLEEALDERYHKEYSNLVPVADYAPTGKRSNRTVLAEVFTGAECVPCVAADVAFEAMLRRYTRQELIVLMYHEHIPGPDPMTNPATLARRDYYKFSGVPSYNIDGMGIQTGGGTKDMARDNYNRNNPAVERRLEVPPAADIKLDAVLENGVVKVSANVKVDTNAHKPEAKEGEAPDYRLHVVLVEDPLRYTGANNIRIHPVVVRAMTGANHTGLKLEPANGAETLSASFDLAAIGADLKKYLTDYEATTSKTRDEPFAFSEKKDTLAETNLAVVAFVQDERGKQVLQAALAPLNGGKKVAAK